MATTSQMAYLQARLQSRHGDRPDEDRWQGLESTAELAGYLDAARSTSLKPWVQQLSADAEVHAIERALRRDWRRYAATVARWAPASWRPAILWMGTLPDLPYLTHLARNGAVFPWMLEDSLLAPLALEELDTRRAAFAGSEFDLMATSIAAGSLPVGAWLDHWTRLWPDRGGDNGRVMERIGREFRLHTVNILAHPLGHAAGPALRRNLAARLNRSFRRESGRIGAVFAHLGLMLLDLERLRGGLVLRALFRDPLERPQWS